MPDWCPYMRIPQSLVFPIGLPQGWLGNFSPVNTLTVWCVICLYSVVYIATVWDILVHFSVVYMARV